jgi:sec-independent protein translocase protein TatA
MNFGPMEITMIVLVLLLLFGGKKIPELMKGLGSGVKEFKKATNLEEEATPRRQDDRYLDERDDRRLEDRRYDDRPGSEPRVEERREVR